MPAANPFHVTVVYNHFPKIAAALVPRVEGAVAKAALDIQANAQRRAPVRTGFLRASIQAHQVGPHHWRVTVGADYGIYVEHGTVRMAARPYMGPSVEAVRPVFLEAMKRTVGSA